MEPDKILLVEDNQMNMELATDLLIAAGFVVCPAENAEEAIALAQTEQPSLILMDIALPEMDGLIATDILKHNELTKDIPVVALTAHAMSGDADRALAAGCIGYITKPIDTRTFAASVAKFIQGKNTSG
jgi:CheY-like chemotaxis protein